MYVPNISNKSHMLTPAGWAPLATSVDVSSTSHYKPFPPWNSQSWYETSKQAGRILGKYPTVIPIIGDLGSLDVLETAAREAGIVICEFDFRHCLACIGRLMIKL